MLPESSSWRARSPVSLQRLHDDARKRQVTLVSDKSEGPTSCTHTFEALGFLARLLTHVPDKNEVCVRYYGAYSVRRRAHWRSLGILSETRTFAEEPKSELPAWSALQARRRRWAELLPRIFAVDPLRCPRCRGQMRILAFVLDHDIVHAILNHMRRAGLDPGPRTRPRGRSLPGSAPLNHLPPPSGRRSNRPPPSIPHRRLGGICAPVLFEAQFPARKTLPTLPNRESELRKTGSDGPNAPRALLQLCDARDGISYALEFPTPPCSKPTRGRHPILRSILDVS